MTNSLIKKWKDKPRPVSILVDENSWMVPYAEKAVKEFSDNGDDSVLCYNYEELKENGIVFIFSWQKIMVKKILDRNFKNLVVHASDLPRGKGFSPLTWQILEGINDIPVCLFEAEKELDSGPVVYKEFIKLEGHELINEIRGKLGELHIELARKYLSEIELIDAVPQEGISTIYPRRILSDSKLNPDKSLREQFDLLRVVDNERYPAFFEINGCKYQLSIKKIT